MEVGSQPPPLEDHVAEEHAAPGAELLGVGAHEVAHAAEGVKQDLGAPLASAGAGAVVLAGKRKPEDDGEATDEEEPEAKRLRAAQEGQAEALAPPGHEGEESSGLDPAIAAAIAAATAIPAADGSLVATVSGGLLEGEPAAAAAVAAQLLQQQHGGGAMPLPLDSAAAAALGLTPEQQVQMQHFMQFPMLSPDTIVAAAANLPAGTDGQPLSIALPLMGGGGGDHQMSQVVLDPSSLMGMPILTPDGIQLTPEQIMQLFSANAMPFVIPLPPGAQGQVGLPPGMAIGPDGNPVYKNWWDEKDEKELISLVEGPGYRLEKLGSEELDWDRIAAHFGGRSQNALRKKYWTLTKRQAAGADSDPEAMELTAVDPNKRPRADRKLWTDEETAELMRLATDSLYRAQLLHLDETTADGEMWEALSMHFACSVQTAKRKYRHSLEALNNGTLGIEKGKRQHHRKNTPYRWMIVSALSELPNNQGTALDIFERIENNSNFVEQLDTRIMPGTKHVPRWKIQVRKVLSADKIFQHTGLKQKHETVWRLNQHELQEAQSSSRNAGRNSSAAAAAAMTSLPAAYDASAGGAQDTDAAAAVGGAPMQTQLTAEEIEAMQVNAAAVGAAAVAPEVAQHMAMMHEQIAAAIVNAPLVMPQEQLQQAGELGMQAMDAQQLQAAFQQMHQAGEAAAAGSAMGEPTEVDHQALAAAAAHGDEHGGAMQQQGREVVEGQLDPHQQLALPMGSHHLDPATLAAIAAASSIVADDGGAAGFMLPMVHTVEVPAPLEDHHQMGGQQ